MLVSQPGVKSFLSYPGVILFVILYLVACPVMVGTLSASQAGQFSIEVFEALPARGAAFLFVLGSIYSILAWLWELRASDSIGSRCGRSERRGPTGVNERPTLGVVSQF